MKKQIDELVSRKPYKMKKIVYFLPVFISHIGDVKPEYTLVKVKHSDTIFLIKNTDTLVFTGVVY